MTVPSFPTQFGQQAVFGTGPGDIFAGSIAGVLKAMQDKEKLERERQEFESKQAYFKTLDTGNQLDNEKKRSELDREKRLLQAKGMGLTGYTQWVGSGAKREALAPILAGMKDPDAVADFLNRIEEHGQAVNQLAMSASNSVQADVAEQTKDDEITKSKAGAQTAQNQAVITGAAAEQAPAQEQQTTRNMQLQGQNLALTQKQLLAELNAPPTVDPSQINSAVNAYRSGAMTIGEAFKTSGVPLPPGVDPNKKFEVQTRGMAIRKAEQKTAAANSLIANSQLEELLSGGVKVTKFTPLKDAVPFDLGRGLIPEKEQQLLSSGGQFISQYVLSVSGKAATDAEREFLMKQIIPRSGDKPEQERQKQLMREAMVQIMFDASQGSERPLADIIESIIGAAKAKGARGPQIQFLRESQRKARLMEQQAKMMTASDLPDMTAGPEPASPDSLQALLDRYGYGR